MDADPGQDADVIVVGGGVIGTAIAWRAARAGLTVTLIDPGGGDPRADDPRTHDRASLVAAGMLGPVSEAVFGEHHLLALNLHAIERFPGFNRELEQETGLATGLRTEGTLAVAYDSGDLAALDRLTDFRHSIGLRAERLDARSTRRLEPFLAPSTRGGVLTPGDLSVDNRRYLAALRAAAARAGVTALAGHVVSVGSRRVRAVLTTSGLTTSGLTASGLTASGLTASGLTASGEPVLHTLRAPHVVVAAGHATRFLDGVPAGVRRAMRPVKGQILRLRHPAGIPPVLTRTVRALVQGRELYLVPRADGELVVGATQEERDDRDVTAGAVHDLLRDAATAVPAVSELIFAEASAGLRPGTSDNGPVLGRLGRDGSADDGSADDASADDGSADDASADDGGGAGDLLVAAGHYRNGILLSAVTADAVTDLISGKETHAAWAPFTPERFT